MQYILSVQCIHKPRPNERRNRSRGKWFKTCRWSHAEAHPRKFEVAAMRGFAIPVQDHKKVTIFSSTDSRARTRRSLHPIYSFSVWCDSCLHVCLPDLVTRVPSRHHMLFMHISCASKWPQSCTTAFSSCWLWLHQIIPATKKIMKPATKSAKHAHAILSLSSRLY